jgi:hypothetical protein
MAAGGPKTVRAERHDAPRANAGSRSRGSRPRVQANAARRLFAWEAALMGRAVRTPLTSGKRREAARRERSLPRRALRDDARGPTFVRWDDLLSLASPSSWQSRSRDAAGPRLPASSNHAFRSASATFGHRVPYTHHHGSSLPRPLTATRSSWRRRQGTLVSTRTLTSEERSAPQIV